MSSLSPLICPLNEATPIKPSDTCSTRAIRDVLDLAIRRLSPGDLYAGDAAAEITVLRDIAGKVDGKPRTDILRPWQSLRIGPAFQ
jgi:hypothetical protein